VNWGGAEPVRETVSMSLSQRVLLVVLLALMALGWAACGRMGIGEEGDGLRLELSGSPDVNEPFEATVSYRATESIEGPVDV